MIIDSQSIERLIWMLYQHYFDFQEIILKDVKVDIDSYLRVKMLVSYYHMETVVRVLARIRVDQDIIIDTKGTIKYGFIQFDFNKILMEYCQQLRYVKVDDKAITIKNPYLKDIAIKDKHIELELLEF